MNTREIDDSALKGRNEEDDRMWNYTNENGQSYFAKGYDPYNDSDYETDPEDRNDQSWEDDEDEDIEYEDDEDEDDY